VFGYDGFMAISGAMMGRMGWGHRMTLSMASCAVPSAFLGGGLSPKTGDRVVNDSSIGMTFADNNCNTLNLHVNKPFRTAAIRVCH